MKSKLHESKREVGKQEGQERLQSTFQSCQLMAIRICVWLLVNIQLVGACLNEHDVFAANFQSQPIDDELMSKKLNYHDFHQVKICKRIVSLSWNIKNRLEIFYFCIPLHLLFSLQFHFANIRF